MPLQTELGEESFRLLREFPGRRTLTWKMLSLSRNRFLREEGRCARTSVGVSRTSRALFWLNLE